MIKDKWKKLCYWYAVLADNYDASSNNNFFTIKDTKLYVLVVILSAKDNKELSKPLRKGFDNKKDAATE